MPVMPSTDSNAPTRSMPRSTRSSRDSGTSTSVAAMTSTPIGTLMPNAHRQESSVVSQPPRSGPRAADPPMVEPQTANAIARSRPAKVALSRDNEVGSIIAPPSPWSTRAPISSAPDPADAASRLAATKTSTPTTNIRRRPVRSATRPTTRSRDAKTRVYASWTHCAPAELTPRSAMIAGTATLTIVTSTMIVATPRLMANSPHQRPRPCSGMLAPIARISSYPSC